MITSAAQLMSCGPRELCATLDSECRTVPFGHAAGASRVWRAVWHNSIVWVGHTFVSSKLMDCGRLYECGAR